MLTSRFPHREKPLLSLGGRRGRGLCGPGRAAVYVALAAATRQHPQVVVGVSPRGSLALLKLARAWAAIQGRDFVIPDDIKVFSQPALAHRLLLDPNLWGTKKTDAAVIEDVIALVPVPVIQAAHER